MVGRGLALARDQFGQVLASVNQAECWGGRAARRRGDLASYLVGRAISSAMIILAEQLCRPTERNTSGEQSTERGLIFSLGRLGCWPSLHLANNISFVESTRRDYGVYSRVFLSARRDSGRANEGQSCAEVFRSVQGSFGPCQRGFSPCQS